MAAPAHLQLAAIADPNRQRILRLVWRRERSAGEIAAELPVTFGAVSQHLRVLREAGFVEVRRDGRFRLYRARPQAMGPLAGFLQGLWRQHVDELKTLAEEEERGGR